MLFQTFTKLTFGLSDVFAVTIQLVNCGSGLYLDTYSLIKHLTLGVWQHVLRLTLVHRNLVRVMLIIKNSVNSMLHKTAAARATKHPFLTTLPTKIGLPDCFIQGPEKHKRLHRLETVATMQS